MYIIGIDGGGTSTQGALANMAVENLSETQVGATNYHNVGAETAKERIGELLDHLMKQANVTIDQISGICMGGAGIDTQADQQVIEKIFRDLGWQGPLIAVNDSVTALAGGNRSLEGAVIISGTGSIAYGSHKGTLARCGGWGQLIDDVGSGYYLGISALKGIMEAYDKRREETKLWTPVAVHLGIQNEEDIIHFLYHPQTGKEKIAELAPIVIQLSGEDALASEIFDSGINGLTLLLEGLFKQMKLSHSETVGTEGHLEQKFSLTLGGSLLIKSERYFNAFKDAVNNKYANVEVHLPYEGPVAGALRIIKEQLEKESKIHA